MNAPAYTSQVAMAAVPNAASRSFLILCILQIKPLWTYLFPNLKTNLRGMNFGSNEGVIDAVDEYLEDQEEGFYFDRISRLET